MRCYRILLLSHLHIYCHLLQQARRPSTKKSYNSKVDEFLDFCGLVQDEAGTPRLSSMPASQTTILAFIGHLASLGRIRSSSLQPYLSAINSLHAVDFNSRLAGYYILTPRACLRLSYSTICFLL